MEYLVLYTSKTGNTEKVAQAIYEQLPGHSKDIKTVEEYVGDEAADLIFLGFWTDRGTCPLTVADVMEKMEGKRIALFGTCGMGNDEKYYASIRKHVEAWLPDECEKVGFFMCQGKMPEYVVKKYEGMRGKISDEQLKQMLSSYQEALLHPDAQDLEAARNYVRDVIEGEV